MDDVASPRDRILDAAEQVFAARGYRGGALNDVAVAAGYTRAGLLHHFPSKEALLQGILERRDERLNVDDFTASISTFDDLGAEFRDRIRDVLEIRPLIQLGHVLEAEATSPDHPAYEWTSRRELRLREALTEMFRRSQGEGTIRDEVDPAVAASLLLATLEGLEAQWLLDESVDILAGMDLLLDLLQTLRND